MKNKKTLGIVTAVIGAVISSFCYIYTLKEELILPLDRYRGALECLMLQFKQSKLLIPFILGIVLVIIGLTIYLKEIRNKKK